LSRFLNRAVRESIEEFTIDAAMVKAALTPIAGSTPTGRGPLGVVVCGLQ
jgi:hypothetical protein